MPARLFCKTGALDGSSFELDREATIGRSSECDIQLSSEGVSSRHARIHFDDGKGSFFLEDLNSRNGTHVDGVEVNTSIRLDHLNVITFAGQHDFIFQVLAGPVSSPRKSATAERPKTIVEQKAPSLPASLRKEEPADGADEVPDIEKTRMGDRALPLPALNEDEADDTPGELQETRMGDRALPLPALNEDEADDTTGELQETRMGDRALPLPNLSEDEATGELQETRIMDDRALPLPALNEDEADLNTDEDAFAQTSPTLSKPYVLTVRGLTDDHLEYTLSEGENVVGRSEECEVQIEDRSLSRKHAIIEISNDTATIRDLGSKNGTYVDDEAVTKPTTVNPGNLLKFGYRVHATLSRK
ncbi:MAG: FHA domain-containing protein [Bacteroidetes bacterium]|nr:FHA domain-containing protein [Bacteroidota bacterium]